MCRHYAFRSNERTKVECTLVHAQNALMAQSRRDTRGHVHPDGWGIAVYNDGGPEVERRATAAFEGIHFANHAAGLFARTVVAHVRRATIGGPSLANTHPFVHGRWAFTHNGTVTAFKELAGELLHETADRFRPERLGTTDSELMFYWLLTRIERAGISVHRPCDDAQGLADLLAESLYELAERCQAAGAERKAKLNVIFTDGNVLVASRWNRSLYWFYQEGLHVCEICGVQHVEHQAGVEYRALVIASEPISHDPWHEIPNHSVVLVEDDIRPRVQKVDVTAASGM